MDVGTWEAGRKGRSMLHEKREREIVSLQLIFHDDPVCSLFTCNTFFPSTMTTPWLLLRMDGALSNDGTALTMDEMTLSRKLCVCAIYYALTCPQMSHRRVHRRKTRATVTVY